jgi:multisubunit Na+/H+ antiporter MnhG subunit
MTFLADVLIWLLLAGGVCFSALGLFGLVIFPDIRSRMYTAVRATLIGVTAITAAALVYAVSRFLETNGGQYVTLALETAFLCAIIVIAVILLSREIERQVKSQ